MDTDDFKLNPASLVPSLLITIIGWTIVSAIWYVLSLINKDQVYGPVFSTGYGLNVTTFIFMIPFLFFLWAGTKVVEKDGGMLDGLIVGLALGAFMWFTWVVFGFWINPAPNNTPGIDVLFDDIWMFLVIGIGATSGMAGFVRTIKEI